MANRLQLRKGTTAQNTAFKGANGELTYDTEKKQIRVHDGSTAGGKIIDDPTQDVTSQVSVATETTAGKAKIATTAIAQAGTNNTDIITAKKLRDALNASGEAPISACRAFLTGIGGNQPSISSSLNITSISKTSTGIYVINYSTPLPTGNATVIANANNSSNVSLIPSCYDSTPTRCELRFYSGGTLTDPYRIHIGVFV